VAAILVQLLLAWVGFTVGFVLVFASVTLGRCGGGEGKLEESLSVPLPFRYAPGHTKLAQSLTTFDCRFPEQIDPLQWSSHISKRIFLIMGEKRNAYRILVGKPKGKRPLGRPRRRWVDNIRMEWYGLD
jgi:hypothetical protein